MTASVSAEKSTNVRVVEREPALTAWAGEVVAEIERRERLRRAAPWYLRAGFSTLGTVAPPLASAWAEHLFRTPTRYPVPERERAALEAAHAGSLMVDGQRLATWTWGRGPTVLLVHGWAGRGGQLHAFVPGLVASGFSVVAFDGPGHGRSDGSRSSLVEHGRAVRAVADALTSPLHAVVAHSMGGASTTFAMHEGLEVPRAVFVAPPWAAGAWAETFARALGLPPAVEQGMRARIEQDLRVPFDVLEMGKLAPEVPVPLLVVHDTEDKEVSWREGAAVAERWPGARLHSTSGLGHKRILEDPAVVEEVTAFLRGR